MLIECQNKTDKDMYFSAVSDLYEDNYAVDSFDVSDFYDKLYK